jgi:hypothetical protein
MDYKGKKKKIEDEGFGSKPMRAFKRKSVGGKNPELSGLRRVIKYKIFPSYGQF